MRWFLGLNHDAPHFAAYARMLQAAVLSVPAGAGLQAHLLFDGPECDLTRWFRDRGGEVIFRESYLKRHLRTASKNPATPHALSHGSGVYLRIEIPDLLRERGWDDETVLYTDSDVLFTPCFRAVDLPAMTHAIACGPDFDRDNFEVFNSGFMLIHLPRWWPRHERFKAFVIEDLPNALSGREWDQYSFKMFFGRDYQRLDPIWNWKPYWGENRDARMLHFHGPKPFLRPALRQRIADPVQAKLANGYFWKVCDEWDRLLIAAGIA